MLPRLVFRRCLSSVPRVEEVYPRLQRGDFGSLQDRHLTEFESILGRERVITDTTELEAYNTDWLRTLTGRSSVVLRPKTVDEVSAVLRLCNSERLAVVPQGGNTGLVGGSTPVFDEVVISMSLMNSVISVDPLSGTGSCESGCVLETLDSRLELEGLMVPYDLGSRGSCQIGGNVSTCAGGLRLIRYGSMLANTLGLEVVLANGEVLDLMKALRKDNTGYHLRQAFIGAEGTLGVITKVCLACPPRAEATALAFMALKSFWDVSKTFRKARRKLNEVMASCEFMDRLSMEAVREKLGYTSPVGDWDFYMLVEVHGSDPRHLNQRMTTFLEESMMEGLVANATLTDEPSKMSALWKIRERIVEALVKQGHLYTYDITLPVDKAYELVLDTRNHLKNLSEKPSVCGFGHIGDGNIHLNIVTKAFERGFSERLEGFVYDWVSSNRGSISSEHGMGMRKAVHLGHGKTPAAILAMKAIKNALDPVGILNPYKIFP